MRHHGLHRLQPLRHAAGGNRFRTGHPLSGRGLCLPHGAAPDHAVHRRQRLQHGRRLAPLRRQCQRASARRAGIRHQGRSQKPQLFPFPAKGARIRNRAPHRCPRIRRPPLSGDAPLESSRGPTVSMRSKERAHDYRYFPEPDLLPVHIGAAWRDEVLRSLPELPEAKRARFISSYGITPYDAEVLTNTRALADYFEAVVKAGAPAKAAANWMQTELLRRLKDSGKEIEASPVAPQALAELVKLVESGQITGNVGKKVFATMFESGRSAAEIVAAEGLGAQVSASAIEQAAREVIAKNPENIAKFKAGNEGVFKFFVGQVMRATRGQANPQAVNDILKRLLSETK